MSAKVTLLTARSCSLITNLLLQNPYKFGGIVQGFGRWHTIPRSKTPVERDPAGVVSLALGGIAETPCVQFPVTKRTVFTGFVH